jgi:putative cardiolipin synthase
VAKLRRVAVALCALILASACASIDFSRPKPTSVALDGIDTDLGRTFSKYAVGHSGKSGFYLLSEGIEALGARVALAERAEQSLDAQYYFILDDPTGHLFIGKLLEAADRGVRVRLLIDDIATKGYEPGMAALHAHPNFEIRIFNPFSRRIGRELDFVTDFRRVNRRMHNKSFTADGTVTIVGGRNIGAEYFAAREDLVFGDLDVLGVGDVAKDVSAAFDDYWNSELAVPVDVLVGVPEHPKAELDLRRERYANLEEETANTRYSAVMRHAIMSHLTNKPDAVIWADFEVVWDPPHKALVGGAEGELLGSALSRAIDEAKTNLFVISPYFVPRPRGVAFFERLRDRGVSVEVLTNSLAATDVAAVHAGYAPYRRDLLEIGVELFEMRPDIRLDRARQRTGMAFSHASLHAKGFTIDEKRLFVGSFNWDPRSVNINTEMGILIDSPELAVQVSHSIKGAFPQIAYQVVLNERGRMRWVSYEDGERVVHSVEPQASVWRRMGAMFMRLLPIRNQL